jgi:peptide deformylase
MDLVTYPDELLTKPSKDVNLESLDIDFINELLSKTKELNAFGLAAVQVGNPVRIFVAKLGKEYEAVINPYILRSSAEKTVQNEGCFSFPGLMVPVERPEQVHVIYHSFDFSTGRTKEIETLFVGIDARIWLHEHDHINGVTFLDYLGGVRKDMYKRKYNKIARRLNRGGSQKV